MISLSVLVTDGRLGQLVHGGAMNLLLRTSRTVVLTSVRGSHVHSINLYFVWRAGLGAGRSFQSTNAPRTEDGTFSLLLAPSILTGPLRLSLNPPLPNGYLDPYPRLGNLEVLDVCALLSHRPSVRLLSKWGGDRMYALSTAT